MMFCEPVALAVLCGAVADPPLPRAPIATACWLVTVWTVLKRIAIHMQSTFVSQRYSPGLYISGACLT